MKAVMKLEPPDSHFLNAAHGWLELGLPSEAVSELARIAPAFQEHPEVLEMRWQICANALEWHRCVEVANVMVFLCSDYSSYMTGEVVSVSSQHP